MFKKEDIINSQTCNICKNKLSIHYSKVQDTMTNENFVIYKCSRCGIGQTFPQPKNLMPYYDNSYYGNRHGFTENHCIKRRIKIVLSATKDRDGDRLLDIGCGDGSFIRAIKDAGWDVAGTEINPNLKLTKGLIIKEDLEDLADYASFDCITMWHTLEHMRNPNLILHQIKTLLKPNGKLIIAVPNNSSFQSWIFKSKWLHLDIPRHLFHFDSQSLRHCLETKGFVIQHQWYQELEYDLLGWTQSALNCIFTTPNIFFDSLRKKQIKSSQLVKILNLFIASFFLISSLPAVFVEKIFNRSGTIIAIARKEI